MSEEKKVEAAAAPRRSTRAPKPVQRLRSADLNEPTQKKEKRPRSTKEEKKKKETKKKKADEELEEEEKEKKEEEEEEDSEEEEEEEEKKKKKTEGGDKKKKSGRRGWHRNGGVEFKPPISTLNDLTNEQREYLESLSLEKIRQRLKDNDVVTTGTKTDIQIRLAYAVLHGVPGRCPTCFGGRLKRSVDGKFFCPGSYDDEKFVSCSFQTDTVVPTPWKKEEGKPL